ncbi:UPF0280 family protein [Fervidobacterium pennivorans subsp. carthaginiensis]|uniref:UPF0280 family protein n=1 Tax=Fervidobacterium pennivorans TaxID=93466 RepID=UPI00355BBE25
MEFEFKGKMQKKHYGYLGQVDKFQEIQMSQRKLKVVKKFYRDYYSERFTRFYVKYKYTDLSIAVDKFNLQMLDGVYDLVRNHYKELEELREFDKEFFESFKPVDISVPRKSSDITLAMVEASKLAGVGPMAAVAGAFAESVGKYLLKTHECKEVIVENGGDIYLNVRSEVRIGIFANFDSEFNKLSIVLGPGEYGVCTSSGKIGHSVSFGNADATCVIARSATIADAFATKYGNLIKSENDFEKVLEVVKNDIDEKRYILGVLFVVENKLLVYGNLRLSI